jgi:flagellar biosynthetic protein FliP
MNHRRSSLVVAFVAIMVLLLICCSAPGLAQQKSMPIPKISFEVGKSNNPQDVAMTLQILFLMTILSLAPALFILTTAFTRIIIVFYFLKQAMGTPQMPPSQVLIGLAMFITFFIMAPTWNKVYTDALNPYLNNKMPMAEAYDKGIEPIREFMFKHTREDDLALFVKMSQVSKPATRADLPTYVLIPSYAISELRAGFQIGFLIFIPFLIIDMVIASILMSMGMMMLPPSTISLPFKILLFILVDGWHLIIGTLVASYQ